MSGRAAVCLRRLCLRRFLSLPACSPGSSPARCSRWCSAAAACPAHPSRQA